MSIISSSKTTTKVAVSERCYLCHAPNASTVQQPTETCGTKLVAAEGNLSASAAVGDSGWTVHVRGKQAGCSLGLSATNQQYFSRATNQPPATSQHFFLRTNQHQPLATSQTNRLESSIVTFSQ
jgi:hypothetical protein